MDTGQSILEVFSRGQSLWETVESLPAKDPTYKEKVNEAISSFQKVAELVEQNDLFSSNETLDDIPTPSLKYISVPYYLGELLQKINSTPQERLPFVERAKAQTDGFLQNCIKLKLLEKSDIATLQREGEPDPETRRNEKIARFRQQKAIKERLAALLKEKLEKGLLDEDQDSEFERETSILFLKQSALTAIENIKSLTTEIEILQHAAKLMAENGGKLPPPPPEPERVPFKPIVIEDPKKKIADKAFLPGWNLPTVSIEEAGLADYKVALQQQERTKAREAKEKLVKEYGDPEDDELPGDNNVYKARDWDNWKDDNPKGSGNTGTKGYHYK